MNENKLVFLYDKRQKDFVAKGPSKASVNLMLSFFSEQYLYSHTKELKGQFPYYEKYDIRKDLEERGYDLTTIKFSIKKKEMMKNDIKH